jgi:hypothetical protein
MARPRAKKPRKPRDVDLVARLQSARAKLQALVHDESLDRVDLEQEEAIAVLTVIDGILPVLAAHERGAEPRRRA